MIMADLKTNYVDDVLDTTKNQLRKYQQIQNDDGTVSFVDVTEYTQVGTSFGAKDINDTNAAINDVNGKLEWKLLVENTNSAYTVTKVYNELLICCGNGESSPKMEMHFVKNYNERLRSGYYYNPSNYGFVEITKNGNTITTTYYQNSNSVTPYMTIYYR